MLLALKLPATRRDLSQKAEGLRGILSALGEREVFFALLANGIATTHWFVLVTYIGAYYHDEFDLAKWALGGLTLIQGAGVVLGSNIGGRIADRGRKRPVILVGSVVCGVLLILKTQAAPTVALAGVYLLVAAGFWGARFSANQATMTEISPGRRATVISLTAAVQQFGIVFGSALGGLVLEHYGYGALGPAAAALALASAAIWALCVPEAGQRAPSTAPIEAPAA